MRFSTFFAAAFAAFSNASYCSAGATEPVICGGNGYVGATNTPWYKKSQDEGTIQNCFVSCTGGCKAISFDTQGKACGATGYVGAKNIPWYKKSQTEGNMKNCLDACRGGCKAVSFDVKYKTCYFYTAEVSSMQLYTVSSPMSFYYFDRACGHEVAETDYA
ncbi:uncharacterized protein BKA55DRAFT_573888 [Fusarium redolens]|uniref:Apple domain-containing protein n=1 Tax=Fusarium redolens TaxID=48865 RepID=A0A9P9GSF3_FUSRE|nr:uncharacterized protein BKA55DRAFT_573888 [Fusarium redolens]KAH7244426.1 hypothetical protein BKA55DRAFT_573888 [Fusarium redolens]